jgi:hypothetical protein
LCSGDLTPVGGQIGNNVKVIISQFNCSSNETDTRLAYKLGAFVNPYVAMAPGFFSVPAVTGTVTFNLTSNTSWTIADNAAWITVNPTSGTGNAIITATYLGNTGALRTGTITATAAYGTDDFAVTISQAGTGVPTNLNLQNMVIAQGNCFSAYQTITLAGNGAFFNVQYGGSVELRAGDKISMLPGVNIYSGGYLWGHIVTNGNFCLNKQPFMAFNGEQETSGYEFDASQDARFFKVYPNPTTGKFILEMNDNEGISTISVEVYGMLGEKVMNLELPATKQSEIDLTGKPAGVYLLRVIRADKMGFDKIVLR